MAEELKHERRHPTRFRESHALKLPPRWQRKIIELRRMVAYALPVGVLSGLGVAGLELVCNKLLWGHLASTPVSVRLVWPIVGLLISGAILHQLSKQER